MKETTPAPTTGSDGGEPALPDDVGERFEVDEPLLRRVLSELTARGASHADLFLQHTAGSSLRLEDGIVSHATSRIDRGIGLRVVVGDQVGHAFTEDLDERAMTDAARTAAAIASGSERVAPVELTARPRARDHYPVRLPWSKVGVERKLPLLRRAADVASAADPAVKRVSVDWADAESCVLVVDERGRLVVDERPMARLIVRVTAERGGELQTNAADLAMRAGFEGLDDEEVDRLAREAVERTLVLFDARRPPAGELPVVLAAGASGILLHEAIGHGLEADFNRKETSLYASMLGKRIAPEFVTIVDDGTIDHARGALNVDDEGNPTERTVLVENGVLASYLHDRISAAHYGVPSTGSGRRQSFRHTVLPRMRCTYMLDGPHERDEVIASIRGTGIVAETFTNGQVQIGAGDFTFYIKNGWLVEDGKVTAPIKDTNIIGNGPEVLRKVTMAANDSCLDRGGWTCGKDGQGVPVSQGLPTVLVSSMTVGGRSA